EAQSQHDATVVDVLQQFERLERTRMTVFTEQLGRFADAHDELKANMEQVSASLHANVKAVNIPQDVQNYIGTLHTGNKPSPHVEYQRKESATVDSALGFSGSSGHL